MFYTIIGTQWGDEGKGKIVDWFSSKADLVVRFQGGNNAGHTIKIKNKEYKLNLLPSGIIRGKKCFIGNGVVLDPVALINEIKILKKKGIDINKSNFFIAENVCLILSIHKIIDEINELSRGNKIIGTTKKGIGPAYEDKVGRRAIRLCDLKYPKLLKKKINSIVKFHLPRLKKFNYNFNKEKMYKELLLISKKITKYSSPVWKLINDAGKKKQCIVFEGAQGALLDIDFGTYPYVTSSNTSSGQIFAGSGFGERSNNKIFGITKAYTTRVGSGPFPTELKNNIGKYLAKKGMEIGTVTKRKRRCGWFDSVLVKQSIKISSVKNIVLTKLDVLDDLEKIKICVGYKIGKKTYDYFPFDEYLQEKIEPVYKSLNGWQESTFGITTWSSLPKNAKQYIKYIEQLIETRIAVISSGPDRNHTIDRFNLLSKI
ncbi:MAG: adenylosuccinate synthase [Pelagibacteraceae bacterium]|nr:adenylosuccinate synthase [Pelagibacteraceae bacterium]|tara:strand:+ start:26448 stop:27734 length:1287 start_codon:yes stop_codon:yes gene_type:complete